VKQQISNVWYMIVSATSTYTTGDCDSYMWCESSTVCTYFPNLEPDDAVKSADETAGYWHFSPDSGWVLDSCPDVYYNCIAWSGGLTDRFPGQKNRLDDWVWPPSTGSPWYDPAGPLQSFDNYYHNTDRYGDTLKRYDGAWNYTRSGATSANNQVDLWRNSKKTGWGGYTHASVRKPGNNHAHGYDWESKPGELMRTFHPRTALSDTTDSTGYGLVDRYYMYDGTCAASARMLAMGINHGLSYEQAYSLGLVTVRRDSLSSDELVRLNTLVGLVPPEVLEEYLRLFFVWQNAVHAGSPSPFSDPEQMCSCASEQYQELLHYCGEKGKAVWPLVIADFTRGAAGVCMRPLMEHLLYPGHEQLMEEVHKTNMANQYGEDGVYLSPSEQANWMSFCRLLLDRDL
jgi:hypothetical protein